MRTIQSTLTRICVVGLVVFVAGCGDPPPAPEDLAEEGDMAVTPVTPPGCTDQTCFNFLSPTPAPCPVKDTAMHPGCISFSRSGNPTAKQKVVLLGGAIFDDTAQWRFVQPILAEKYDVVSFDYLGFGRSSHPPGRFSMITQAEVALGLMAYLGWTKAHFVAFSLGGTVMQTLGKTAQYRGNVASMVGVNPVGIMTPPPNVNFPAQNMIFFSNLPGTGFNGTQAMLRELHFSKDRVTEEFVKDVIKLHVRYNGDRAYDKALFEGFSKGMGLTFPNEWGAFAGIPFGIVWSANDGSQPPNAWIPEYQHIPNIEVVAMLPNCGHNAVIDCSHDLAQAYMKFIDAHPVP